MTERVGQRLGPELAFEAGLGFVEGAVVGAGGQVLPAAVGDQHAMSARSPSATALAAMARRGVQDGPGRDAGEDALFSSSSRVRRNASAGPTEKRVVSTLAS